MGALEEILQRHPVWRGGALARASDALPSGFDALDAELPGAGWPRQGLAELLVDDAGIGELGIVLPALASLTSAGKRTVWVSPPHTPYAPALLAAGIDLTQLLIVGAASRRDALWAAEQALRSGSCHAVAAWIPRARYAELQRLAVAAESGQAVAFVFRPLAAATESSPACLRLALAPAGHEVCIRILKRRGAPASAPLRLPLKRPFHALGRIALPGPRGEQAAAARRLGLPVHA
ncbi:MAG TPA: translesion DNA synthesis-associated protein ImuA [Burkholderiales bacterium]